MYEKMPSEQDIAEADDSQFSVDELVATIETHIVDGRRLSEQARQYATELANKENPHPTDPVHPVPGDDDYLQPRHSGN